MPLLDTLRMQNPAMRQMTSTQASDASWDAKRKELNPLVAATSKVPSFMNPFVMAQNVMGAPGMRNQAVFSDSLYGRNQAPLPTVDPMIQGAAGRSVVDDPARAEQMGLLGMLRAQASGQGPSAAQAVLQQGTDRAIQAAASNAASMRGVAGPAAQRAAMYQSADAIQGAAAPAAQIAAQEQAAGQQALTGAVQGLRGQDLQSAGQNDAFLDNLLGLQQGYAQLQQGGDQARLQAQLQLQQLQQQQAQWKASQPSGFQKVLGTIGQVGSVLGGVAGAVTGLGNIGRRPA